MRDFAKRTSKNTNTRKKKSVFRSKKKSSQVISSKVIFFILSISLVLIATSFFYFRTDIESIKPESFLNNVTIDFPTSLMENSILIESSENEQLECEYFVQIGAYGNKKYALEAEKILENEIQNIRAELNAKLSALGVNIEKSPKRRSGKNNTRRTREATQELLSKVKDLIRQHPGITAGEISAQINETASPLLSRLKSEEHVKPTGKGRGTTWNLA